MPQLEGLLSPQAREDWKLIKDAGPEIKAAIDIIVASNAKLAQQEDRNSGSTREYRDNMRGLNEETQRRIKIEKELAFQLSEAGKREAQLKLQLSESRRANKEYAQSVNEVTSAYRKLEVEHKRLEGQAKELGAIYGSNSTQFKEAAAAANEYGNKLKAIDAELGNHRRNVGNYASGYNQLNVALSQISRELPNFGQSIQTGILSLSNQWGQLEDGIRQVVERNRELIAQGKPTVSVFKQILTAILSWQTALNVGIALLTAYSDEIADFIQNVSKSDAALKKSKEESIKSFKQEETAIKVWKVEVDDATTSQTRLLQIKNEIVSKYPGTKSIIESETNLQDGLSKAIEKVSGALLIQARIRSYANAIAETETKQLLREMSTGDILKGGFLASILGVGAGAASATSDVVTKFDKTLDVLNKKLLEAVKEFQATGGDVLLGSEKDKKLREDKFSEFYNQYISSLKDRNDAQKEYDIQALERQKITSEGIINDENETLAVRLQAVQDYYDAKNNIEALNAGNELKTLEESQGVLLQKQADYDSMKLKLTDLQHKTLLNQLETLSIRIKAINERRDTEILKNEEETEQKRLDIITKSGAKQVKDALEQLNNIRANFKGSGNRREDARALINEQIDYLEGVSVLLMSAGVNVDLLGKKIDELRAKINNMGSDWRKTLGEVINIFQQAGAIAGEITGLLLDASQRKITQLEEEGNKIKENEDLQIQSINNQALSEEEKERRIRIARAESEAQQKAIEQRIRIAKRKQAIADRAANINDIIGKTAIAVMSAFQTYGSSPIAYVVAALNAALGAAQIARVLATPLPSYAEGTEDHPGGWARFGENGPELVKEPGKKPYLVNKETIADLPEHTKIFNEDQMRMMFLNPQIMRKAGIEGDSIELLRSDLNTGLKNVVKAVKGQNNTKINFYGTDPYRAQFVKGN